MTDVARKELKSDLISAGFLLIAADMADAKSASGIFSGPTIHDGRIYDVRVTVVVTEARS